MELFNIIAVLVTLSALFSFINYRYIRLPTSIGLMLIAMIMSISLIFLGKTGVHIGIRELVEGIDFNQTLLVGMLSFLLFAGALHVDINDLLDNKWEIGIFATLGIIFSTMMIGTLIYQFNQWSSGPNIPYIYCLLFGALISPTDPIAVLGILKTSNAPQSLKVKIAGESLFNDGIGVVIFIVLLGMATGGHEISPKEIALLFTEEVAGGVILGLLLGWVSYQVLKRVDQYQVEVLITLALVIGGYALALKLHTSGPIAIVIAGLMIGNQGRKLAMSDKTREHLDTFWELIDEVLNSVLFVLIGLEILIITFSSQYLVMSLIAIPIVLFARFLSIGIPVSLLRKVREFSPNAVKILTWGGLRGGISVALALSIPDGPIRDIFLTMTYAVVVFSILVQGLTIKYLIKS
ncbi:MAG: cation:proton antiporter [Thermodesulfobacteriota bacterium]